MKSAVSFTNKISNFHNGIDFELFMDYSENTKGNAFHIPIHPDAVNVYLYAEVLCARDCVNGD